LNEGEHPAARLIVGANWIGDAVMSLPMLRSLRRASPHRPLIVWARRGPASVYRASSLADEVLVAPRSALAARRLRPRRLGEAWLVPNSLRSAVAALASGARERIGYDTDGRGILLTHRLPPPPRTQHQLRDYDALLSSRGVTPDLGPPRIAPAEAAVDAARASLAQAFGRTPEPPLLLLAPGAAFSWTKRWPAARFGELARTIAGRGMACGVVIGPGEEDLAREVAAASGLELPSLGASLDPEQLAALLSLATLFVGNDSGPMHLAAAVGTPVVAFFGPTDPGRTAPSGAPARVLDRYLFCSPCFLKTCPYRHECMEEIGVDDAMRAIEEVGSRRPSPESQVPSPGPS
jgi:heptosyltransferase-2